MRGGLLVYVSVVAATIVVVIVVIIRTGNQGIHGLGGRGRGGSRRSGGTVVVKPRDEVVGFVVAAVHVRFPVWQEGRLADYGLECTAGAWLVPRVLGGHARGT